MYRPESVEGNRDETTSGQCEADGTKNQSLHSGSPAAAVCRAEPEWDLHPCKMRRDATCMHLIKSLEIFRTDLPHNYVVRFHLNLRMSPNSTKQMGLVRAGDMACRQGQAHREHERHYSRGSL